MNNKTILANIEKITSYIEALEQENEKLKVELAKAKGEFPDTEKTTPQAFDCLAVTQVQVFPFKEGPSLGNLKGLAQIVLNDQMVIRGLRVMDGVNGLYVRYPLDPFYKGEDFKSICDPFTRALREHIENCVLEKYQAAIEA